VSRLRKHVEHSGESGFTMVELIVAIAILGIISTTVGVVGVVMFKTMGQTQARLDETRGPRFASVYWVPDVASTESVNPGTTCGSAANTLVTLQWPDDRPAFGVTTVTYGFDTVGTVTKVVRRLCTLGSTTPLRTTTIAPNVVQASTTVTCGTGASPSYSACVTNDPDKSLLLTIAAKNGGTFSVDAAREVT
jgi:prepilin-type N-terminal cleavage/methylation domain-containing protein